LLTVGTVPVLHTVPDIKSCFAFVVASSKSSIANPTPNHNQQENKQPNARQSKKYLK